MKGRSDRVAYTDGITSPPTRTYDNPGPVIAAAYSRAAALVCLTRDEGADGIGRFLDRLDRADLYAVSTVLAAMVPDDVPAGELLSWLNGMEFST